MWAFLALGAAVLTSFNPNLCKRMLKDVEPIIVVWGATFFSLPLLGLFTFALTSQTPTLYWLFVVGVIGSASLNAIAHLASTTHIA